MINGTVDRSQEHSTDPDAAVYVELDNGYKLRFWIKGLTDEKYIEITNIMMQDDNRN